jgi:hypothetical protein
MSVYIDCVTLPRAVALPAVETSQAVVVAVKERAVALRASDMTPDQAATKLQGIYRSRVAKTKLRNLLLATLEKCIDPATGVPFYFNRKTGQSSWTKPALLRHDTVPGERVYVRRRRGRRG